MVEYGQKDRDETAYKHLLATVGDAEVLYIMHYPRVSLGARACKLPGSLKVQAIMKDKSLVTCFQPAAGKPAKIL